MTFKTWLESTEEQYSNEMTERLCSWIKLHGRKPKAGPAPILAGSPTAGTRVSYNVDLEELGARRFFMGFREWLLKEDPDSVDLGDENLYWNEGLTFSLFDNYYVCSVDGYEVTHSDLMGEVSSCRDAISAGLGGSITPEDVSSCIQDSRVITTYGVPSRRAMELMLMIPQHHSSRIATSVQAPDIINGRIWIESKVVSFWNGAAKLMRHKDKILDFVRLASGGDPRRFRYDVTGYVMDYDEFVGGGRVTRPTVFDPSKVHTMLPGPAKAQMMGAMGFMRSKPVDIRGKAAREGD